MEKHTPGQWQQKSRGDKTHSKHDRLKVKSCQQGTRNNSTDKRMAFAGIRRSYIHDGCHGDQRKAELASGPITLTSGWNLEATAEFWLALRKQSHCWTNDILLQLLHPEGFKTPLHAPFLAFVSVPLQPILLVSFSAAREKGP